MPAQVWDPYTLKNKHKIESLQKYALRICSGRWFASYEELLDLFELPTLASYREYLRVMTCINFIVAIRTFHLTSSIYNLLLLFVPVHPTLTGFRLHTLLNINTVFT